MRKSIIALALLPALLGGCVTDGVGMKQGIGTLGGAAIGGLGGAQLGKGKGQLAFTAAGVLLGAFLGSEIGSSLDRADEMYAQQAASRALAAPVGHGISWSNPQSGNRGTITTTREGRTQAGEYCREYTQTIYVGGRPQQAYGQACQMRNGDWKVVQ